MMHSSFPIEAEQFPLFINKKPACGCVFIYRLTVYYKVQGSISASRFSSIAVACELFSRQLVHGKRADFVFDYGINRQADLMERHTRHTHTRRGGVYGRVYIQRSAAAIHARIYMYLDEK